MSSVELSGFLKKVDKDMVLIIGSPDGLTPEVKARADMMLSLSRMTFTHELSQLILFEQLYRAFSILRNEKYHRA